MIRYKNGKIETLPKISLSMDECIFEADIMERKSVLSITSAIPRQTAKGIMDHDMF